MAMGGGSTKDAVPNINMTPMIDILLVLLIIFMVISPKKPHRFESQIPERPPDNQEQQPDQLALLITIPIDGSKYKLNTDEFDSLQALGERLFKALDGRPSDRKAVFIKAPRQINYGEVVKVIDTVKQVGGAPIGLQIEGLDER
jgi:biopolymer transport protein ExbD